MQFKMGSGLCLHIQIKYNASFGFSSAFINGLMLNRKNVSTKSTTLEDEIKWKHVKVAIDRLLAGF